MWKGIRRDPETGLLYMRHRFYSVVTGQFLSSDPIGVWGDSGNMGNEYSYAWNRPLVVGDPLGLQTDTTKSGSPSTTPPTFEEWAPTVKTDKGREVGPSKSKKNDGDEFADRKKQTEIDKKELVDQHKNAKVVGDSSLRYNCGGYVFLGGKAWLNVDIPAPRILKDNGYKRVEKDADVKPGDVVTYLNTNRGIRGNPKNIEHVGIVIGVGENGKVRVRSKWGAGPLVEHDVDEVPNDYKDGRRVVNVCYYRTARGSNDTSVPPLNPGPGGAASPPSKVPQGPEGEKR
jgi:RHS repeat-associated protein